MTIKKNLLANYMGAGWTALMNIAFVPFYLHFIGAEGYGLVGFFVMLSASLSVLDAGLAAVAIREAAGFMEGNAERRLEVITLLRSIEVVFLGVSVIAGLLVSLSAPLIVRHWLNVPATLIADTTWAVTWMGLTIALQFFISFYSGCLTGFQRQVGLNVINIVGSTVRGGGAVLVLWLVSQTVQAFFAWQAIGALGILLAQRVLYVRSLQGAGLGLGFTLHSLKRIRHFLAGMGAINISSLLLTQVDKIILSSVLSLKAFGYYSLAWTLGTMIYRLIGPVFNSYYPRITQLLEQKNKTSMMEVYTQGSRVIAGTVVPISLWFALFSHDILELWTRNSDLANQASGALSVLALGTMFNAFMQMPYALQLAYSYTRLVLAQNIVAIVLLTPLTWFFATNYSLTAVAVPWLLVNAGYVVIGAPLIHRYLAIPGLRDWYIKAVLMPVIYAGGGMLLVKIIWMLWLDHKATVVLLPIALLVGSIMGLMSTQLFTLNKIRRWKNIL